MPTNQIIINVNPWPCYLPHHRVFHFLLRNCFLLLVLLERSAHLFVVFRTCSSSSSCNVMGFPSFSHYIQILNNIQFAQEEFYKENRLSQLRTVPEISLHTKQPASKNLRRPHNRHDNRASGECK